ASALVALAVALVADALPAVSTPLMVSVVSTITLVATALNAASPAFLGERLCRRLLLLRIDDTGLCLTRSRWQCQSLSAIGGQRHTKAIAILAQPQRSRLLGGPPECQTSATLVALRRQDLGRQQRDDHRPTEGRRVRTHSNRNRTGEAHGHPAS